MIAFANALSKDFMSNIIFVQIYNGMKISKMLMAVTNRTTTTLEIINVQVEKDFSYNPYLADLGEQRL